LPSTVQFAPAGQLAPILDVFTDGSCLFPADRDLRVASWAVVLAMPFQLEFQAADFRPLAAQPLDGLLQSAFRAELKALTVALDFAVTTRRGIRVWTDCQSVIDVWITFVRDGRSVNANAKHSDLLQDLQRLAQDLDLACVEVLKVPAHVDAAAFTNDLERWLVTGNDFADRAAKQANLMRSEGDWALWHAYAQQLQLQQFQANQVRAHIVAVGKFWTASAPPPVSPEVRWSRPVKAGRAQPVPRWEAPDVLVLVGPTFLRSFGSELADRLGRWLTRIRAPSEPLQWISYHQLFVSFHKDEGPFFVTKTDGKWVAETGNVSHLANHVRLGQRVKHFRLMLQQFLRDCQVTFTTATVRPRSEWIACFKGAIAFQLAQSEWDMLEGYFASQLARPVAGDGKGLDQLTL
jgi:ribonuclease HI